MITLRLNGETRELPQGFSVADMLAYLKLDRQPVLVELNGEALLKKEFDQRKLESGDTIELIRIVAGG